MEDPLIRRITVLGLILAILFGILNYIPVEKTYDSLTAEAILKVFSITFFNTVLAGVLIYLLFIGINLGYGMENVIPEKLIARIYNFTVTVSFMIIVLTIFYVILINSIILVPFLTPKIGSYILIVAGVAWLFSFMGLLQKYVWLIRQF